MPASNGTVYVKLLPTKRELQLSIQTPQGTLSLGLDKNQVDALIRSLILTQGQMLDSLRHN